MVKVGICGYGVYTPKHFVNSQAIDSRSSGLGLSKKALAGWDEDSVTMGAEAAAVALAMAKLSPNQIEAIYMGSESPPYAVNPSSTIIGDILGVGEYYQAVDLQFACKAAAAGFQMAYGQVASGHITRALVIGADKSQAQTGDVLEWSAGAAGAAVVIGSGPSVLATLESRATISSDTPDFWRRDGEETPSHAGRFTGEPGYFHHVLGVVRRLSSLYGYVPGDFHQVILHMPNGKFPEKAAHILGFSPNQLRHGFTITEIGNPYAANALFGLNSVLDQAKPYQKILMVAYGSGAGADALVFNTTKAIEKRTPLKISERLASRRQVSIEEYRKANLWR